MMSQMFERLLHRVIVRDIAADDRYPCLCGTDPYIDGEPCPKCAAIMWVENNPLDKDNGLTKLEERYQRALLVIEGLTFMVEDLEDKVAGSIYMTAHAALDMCKGCKDHNRWEQVVLPLIEQLKKDKIIDVEKIMTRGYDKLDWPFDKKEGQTLTTFEGENI